MFRLKEFLAVCMVGLLASRAGAAELSVSDFAYGVSVTLPAEATIAELPLPDLIYRSAVFPDLRDLRVFDFSGRLVMHSLTLPEPAVKRWESSPPFFPVKGVQAAEGAAISVSASSKNAAVQVFVSGATTAAEPRTVAYLVDLRALRETDAQPAVTSVVLGWRGLPEGVPLRMTVEASDDLQRWRPVHSGAVLGRFVHGTELLTINRLELSRVDAQYLKLCWAPLSALEITAVTLQLVERKKPALVREWEQVEAMAGAEAGEYYSTLGGAFPVDRIRLDLHDSRVVELSVYSRSGEQAPWIRRGGGKAFRISHAGEVVNSEPLSLNRTTDRQWKLVAEGKDAVAGLPSLGASFGWLPHRLQFLPQGAGPYTVAYGNGLAAPADFGVASLKSTVDRALGKEEPTVAHAQIVSTQLLGGPSKLGGPGLNRKAFLLWGVLLAGVALFGGMAVRLYQEMKSQKS